MKTKTFLLLCLFMGFGLSQLQAQKGKNGNGTESYRWYDIPIELPLFSENGAELDVLTGTVTFHFKDHFLNNVCTRSDYNMSGSIMSEKTGEVFKYNETGKQTAYSWEPLTGFGTWTERFIGDHGTRVKMEFYMDYSTWEITIIKISWPGDKYYDGN